MLKLMQPELHSAGEASIVHPVQHAPATAEEHVVGALRDRILKGEIKQGQRLIETTLARELCVSQGTVRAAIRKLTGEGLLRNIPRRGSYVTSYDAQDILEIMTLRKALDSLAASLAAENDDRDAKRFLLRCVDGIENGKRDDDHEAIVAHDHAFHKAVVALSKHKRLEELCARLSGQTQMFLVLSERLQDAATTALVELHRDLANAIIDGNAAQAAKLAEQHCDKAGQYLRAVLNDSNSSPVALGLVQPNH